MRDWRNVLVSQTTHILKAIEIIDASSLQIVLVVDENNRLLGTVTDGDIRRGILKGISLEDHVQKVMNPKPCVAREDDNRETILSKMKLKRLSQMPVVDGLGHLIGLEILEDIIQTPQCDNWVVLMAGGLGTRLRPLTEQYPKPLLNVGGKPILETILENFIGCGFRRFYISISYKADLIEDFFQDGARWNAEIRYIREDKKMGTAGALGLIPDKHTASILVMNGDVLTKVNFQQLLEFHRESKAKATMCVREYDFQVPYGVARVDEHRLMSIEEKPTHRFFVNAGIYVLEPKVLDMIPRNSFFDMPTLFNKLIEQKQETAVFPIREYWLDIGRMKDFEQAEGDFGKIF